MTMSDPRAAAYDQDLYAWAMSNAQRLREGRLAEIDAENIAEELEAMGRSERRQLLSRLSVLVAHLLKWRHQPERRSRSWRNTIVTQREDLLDLLAESPSLRPDLAGRLERAYARARRLAENETGLPPSVFPAECPFDLEEVVDGDFWPEEGR
jgi:hypothetical protein